MKRTLKIAGIIIGGLLLISVVLKIVADNQRGSVSFGPSNIYSQKSAVAPQSVGMGRSGSVAMSVPSGKPMPDLKEDYAVSSDESSPVDGSAVVDKKIIKNGNLNLRVDSVDKAAEKISEVAKSYQGDVSTSNFNQYKTNSKSGNISIKVPFKNFESAFNDIKKIAIVVLSESTTGQDVTEQYSDLQAQLKNKQAEEQSFVRLLDKAEKMDDIISITGEVSRVRGEIERLEGRIRLMDSQADMSTINASLTEDVSVTVVDSWRPWQVVKESVRELIKSIQEWVDFIIRLVITVIPVLVLYGIIIYVFYRIGRVIYRKFWHKNDAN